MKVLCPALYERLGQLFGRVKVANQGQSLQLVNRKENGKLRLKIVSPGEYYCVNCPFCGDQRNRLWINHRFTDHRWLSVCYNETRCLDGLEGKLNRDRLFTSLFNSSEPIKLPVIEGTIVDARKPLEPISLPGDILMLNELQPNHPAVNYLSSRGYSPNDLSFNFGVGYCNYVFDRADYLLKDRIFIPLFMNQNLVGWQGRFIGDVDWKTTGIKKYYNLRGMSKRQMLYNYDVAKEQPMVVLCEGAADVWRVGSCGAGLLGSDLADDQGTLVYGAWSDKPIAVFLDSDAQHKSEEIVRQLRLITKAPVFNICHEGVKDPGSLTFKDCWTLINKGRTLAGLDEFWPER